MIRGSDVTKKKARAGAPPGEGAGTCDRSLRWAVVACAAAEFVAIALALYYRLAR